MAINAPWRPFTEAFISREANTAGVYELGDFTDEVVYIGSGDDVQRQLRIHLNEVGDGSIGTQAVQYRAAYTGNRAQRERELFDQHVQLHGRPPLCNDRAPTPAAGGASHGRSLAAA